MNLHITSYCQIHDKKVVVNDRLIFYMENFLNFADFLKAVYKQEAISYPKFFKMDSLSKLGFLATELVLREKPIGRYCSEEVGVVLSNASASLDTDIIHNDSVKDKSHYFPSPSVFVYTLPNIVIGEICIKNKIKGENAFLVSEFFDGNLLESYVQNLFLNEGAAACICGWIELLGNNYNALSMLIEREENMEIAGKQSPWNLPFTAENLNQLIIRN